MSGLTRADIELLRRPFAVAAIKFRPAQKNPGRRVRCLTYIDSRLAVERLIDVDPNYGFSWEPLYENQQEWATARFPTRGILTVKGVTRIDVGQLDSSVVDDKYAKSVASDALKRAAVLFGVGSYLYALGDCSVSESGYWTKSNQKGEKVVAGLNEKGIAELRGWYANRIAHASISDRYGDPISYGDVLHDVVIDDVELDDTPVAVEVEPTIVEQPAVDGDAYAHAAGALAATAGKRANVAEAWMNRQEDKDKALVVSAERALAAGAEKGNVEDIVKKYGFEKLLAALDGIEIK